MQTRDRRTPEPFTVTPPLSAALELCACLVAWGHRAGVGVRVPELLIPWMSLLHQKLPSSLPSPSHQTAFTIITGSSRCSGGRRRHVALPWAPPCWGTQCTPPGSQGNRDAHAQRPASGRSKQPLNTQPDSGGITLNTGKYNSKSFQDKMGLKKVYAHQPWIIFSEERFPNISMYRTTGHLSAHFRDPAAPRASDSLSEGGPRNLHF